jgi:hypothetical protein
MDGRLILLLCRAALRWDHDHGLVPFLRST